MRDVVITVKNVDDPGKITFSSVQPKVGIPFTATLSDEDGGVKGDVKWQWYNGDPDIRRRITTTQVRIADANVGHLHPQGQG